MKLQSHLLLFLLTLKSFAQSSNWQSLTISDGLSQGMIFDMIQDHQGFIWIGTKDGLNRYDGYHFKVFTHDAYNIFSISGNTCTALLEDRRGRIWVGTEKDGLNLFDPQTQRFYRANVSDNTENASGNYQIVALKEDTQGTIWVITNKVGKVFQIKNFPIALPDTPDISLWIQKATFQKQPPLFLQNQRGLDSQISLVLNQKNTAHPPQNAIITQEGVAGNLVIQDKNNRFWVVQLGVLKYWVPRQKQFISISSSNLNFVEQFQDGTIVLANHEYIWLFSPDELLNIKEITPSNAFTNTPEKRKINRCIKDKSGILWVGTAGYGLYKFNPLTKLFHSFLPKYSPAMLMQDRTGNIFVHANYNPAYQYFRLNTTLNVYEKLPVFSGTQDIHDFLFQDSESNYWLLHGVIGTFEKHLSVFSNQWQFKKDYPISTANLTRGSFKYRIFEDTQKNIWIGLTDGFLSRLNPHSGQLSTFNYQHLLPKGGTTVECFAMYQDIDQVLWIGTQRGLIKVKEIDKIPQFSIYQNNKQDRNSLSNDFVSGMTDDPLDPHKYLWISTKGGGLERLDKQQNTFQHFTEKAGLPNQVVYGIVQGDDKNLWMSTNRGITRLNPKSLIFSNYNKSDGLQDEEFNTCSYYKAPNGDLLFGGVNGLNVFKASSISTFNAIPTIKIFGLKINNKNVEPYDETAILKTDISLIPAIKLAYNQNLISLEFGLMDFSNSIKNRFRYKLEGIDNDWIEAGTNNIANYAQLPDGKYVFKVMGTISGEAWSKPIELHIYVTPPFYRTWWAYLVYFLVISYIIYRFYEFQINKVKLSQELAFKQKEAERLAELDQLKTNFFANISHEFRTPLTLILSPIEDLIKRQPHDEMYHIIRRNAQRLLELINQILDLNKLELGQMAVSHQGVQLPQYFRTQVSMFSSLAESKGIQFSFSQSHQELYGIIDKDKIEKIVTNLLANALKFTETGGNVSIVMEYLIPKNTLAITIADTGVGIKADKLAKIFDRFYQVEDAQNRRFEGTGIGLALVKELVAVLGGSIAVTSTEGIGTTFVVKLPVEFKSLPKTAPALEEEITPIEPPNALLIPVFEGRKKPENDLEAILLIVDDNADIRRYVSHIFEAQFRIIEAANGKEGIQKALETTPDLVISDLMMPEMDGFEFCKILKSDERTSHIPIVMLTAKANVESRIEGFELGADDFLTKPFNAIEIQARVRNLLDKQHKLQQYFGEKIITLKPSEVRVNSLDEVFLLKAKDVLEKHLADSRFGAEQFAQEMNLSNSQFLRKLKALTNQTINEFIRDFRLQRAAELLTQKAATVSEISYQVGYENLSYFTKVFKEKFGKLPSEY